MSWSGPLSDRVVLTVDFIPNSTYIQSFTFTRNQLVARVLSVNHLSSKHPTGQKQILSDIRSTLYAVLCQCILPVSTLLKISIRTSNGRPLRKPQLPSLTHYGDECINFRIKSLELNASIPPKKNNNISPSNYWVVYLRWENTTRATNSHLPVVGAWHDNPLHSHDTTS